MYDIAKKARAGMKSKAERLAGQKDRKTDSSDWSPAPELNADVKTGMRPVSRQARKRGGKVLHKAAADAPKQRADRMPRKAGDRVETKGEQPLVDRYINRDLKKANEYRDGKKHDGALKTGGRAAKGKGGGAGAMTMEEMLQKYPAPAKPTFRDKSGNVPVPPRRPANVTPAATNRIKPDESKRLTGDYISPQEIGRKNGGRTHKMSGGGMDLDARIKKSLDFSRKRDEETKKSLEESKKKYPGKPWIERVQAEMNEKFSPAYFANLKASRKKELSEDKGYQDFAARRSKKGDDNDDADEKRYGGRAKHAGGGRTKKADGGPMPADPRLSIVSPKMLNFAQDVVTPGLKKGGRTKKADAGPVSAKSAATSAGAEATQALKPVNVTTAAPNTPAVGSGLLPPTQGDYVKAPVYDPTKYEKDRKGTPEEKLNYRLDRYAKYANAQKGGRIKKQIGGGLSRPMSAPAGAGMAPQMSTMGSAGMAGSMPQMPQLPPQAMANAQGRPFQGGQFMPPGLANRLGMPAAGPQTMAPAVMPPSFGGTSGTSGVAPAPAPMPMARAYGGRTMHALGGETKSAKKSKSHGKTNINIIIAAGKKEPQGMMPDASAAPIAPPGGPAGIPVPLPPQQGMGAMPPAGPPMAPPMGPPPMPRKAGGRVSKVAKSFKDMTAGAGSGEGRLQKTDIAKRAPHKAGGKVYRSYKDMDAGSGSGRGRLEKTEIQSRKK